MTVKECIAKNGWGVGEEAIDKKAWNVDIGFINSETERDDETEFSITAYNDTELEELFVTFCKENQIADNTVTYISVVEMAYDFEDLS